MCATECVERAAVRVMQLEPESLECSETCETPDAMDCMDYVSQNTYGDNFSGSHAIIWRPDQSVYVAHSGNGCLNFGAPDSLQCNKSFSEAAQPQQAQQEVMCSAAGASSQQQHSPRGFCCTYLSSTQAATGITPQQRASVVDNMVAAAASLGLDNDSLFLAVQLLDRYSAGRPTELQLLQPTAIACLRIAGKYEGCQVPPAACFSQLMLTPRPPAPAAAAADAGAGCCCDECSSDVSIAMHFSMAEAPMLAQLPHQQQQQHVQQEAAALASSSRCSYMQQQQQQQAGALDGEPAGCSERAVQLLNKLEMTVLQQLDFRVAMIPTAAASKRAFIAALLTSPQPAAAHARQYSQLLYCCVSYLCEVALLEYNLLPLLPQQIAAAALAVAHMLLGLPLDDAVLAEVTGFCTGQLLEPMQVLVALHCSLWQALQSGHPYAVTRKYCGDDACSVGCSVPPIVSRDDPRVTLVAHKVKPEHGQQQQQ